MPGGCANCGGESGSDRELRMVDRDGATNRVELSLCECCLEALIEVAWIECARSG